MSRVPMSEGDSLRVMIKCAILRSKGMMNNEISAELRNTGTNVSAAEVAEYLDEARDRKFLRYEVYPPPEIDIAERIREHYGLRRAYVFHFSNEITDMLTWLAAAYLEERLEKGTGIPEFRRRRKGISDEDAILQALRKFGGISLSNRVSIQTQRTGREWLVTDEGKGKIYVVRDERGWLRLYEMVNRIAVGPGETTLKLADALSDQERSYMKVGSTTSPARQETHVASNILIGVISGKWKCGLYRFDPQMTDEEQVDYADMLIFGIDGTLEANGVTPLAIIQATGMSRRDMDSALLDLSSLRSGRRGVAFINYQAIDEAGRPLDWKLDEYKRVFRGTLMKLDVIRKMAKHEKKEVICIASGSSKAEAIRAGLRGKYFNVLITDYDTAVLLS